MSLRERKVAKKKEDILRSASLVISRNGYQNATMEDIAAELLMTKGALYYYFKNKEEILYSCHDLILSAAMEQMEAIYQEELSSMDKMKKAIKTHLDIAIREKEVFNLIVKPEQLFSEDNIEEIIEKRDQYARIFDKIIAEGVKRGEFTVSDKKMARMIILGATNWVQVWYSPEGKFKKEKVEDIYAEYFLKMLA
ncbi:TetR/AcrR family transcriptional regulator [Microbacterium sp. APC 3898]|uniref:TetR/AcrR family transcriptional regulator n=1 Tax=Planococcus notacanthi TaxID=3035188 RepID=A0ABT7ZKK5_9BACL|nr:MULTISPECIES: TetR/AcrR family transcriptional regulator [Terrabacteria group]MBF6632451.1 TetR family transcriptional regulator [Planococcus sp. (in: firmicutes)]MDN3427671.1 TetR/AcrR family transcriptional regulator [Planococcus sp. APC 4016]MDN3437026.1 TetR/AcrR family transcriptional regulator [Planococcus sp. APC 3900]MDN3499223.1 TetR/AcrR family transcriptional regulator [Microbacterium sp. APC 3898]